MNYEQKTWVAAICATVIIGTLVLFPTVSFAGLRVEGSQYGTCQ